MVNYNALTLDRTFAALADPTRRALLARLSSEARLSVSELSAPFNLSLPAVMKHLDVLANAGLISRIKEGRTVNCELRASPLASAADWLQHYAEFWSPRLDRLAALIEDKPCKKNRASSSRATSKPRPPKSSKRGPSRP
jgi:DNA-binding transcriptional ArsR family regulator